jgi:hypothetical protein
MADGSNNLGLFLKDLADAIRKVKGTSEPINPQQFASLILEMGYNTVGGILNDKSIELLSEMCENGTYTLRYDGNNGGPLENFNNICTLTVDNSNVSYSDFINENIPPYMASTIGVYNSSNEKIGIIPLDDFKKPFGTRLYRFGLLSDVHDYEGSEAEASDDFYRALTLFNDKEDVKMTCICGDITQNATENEFAFYANDVARFSPNTPVYTTTGNHDAGSALNNALWEHYTGNPRVFELSETLPNGSIDHFLFFGMSYWSLGTNRLPYLLEDIEWLEEKLDEYRNERCFVFTHLFFPDRAGNLNGIYPQGNWLDGTQLELIEKMVDKYVNTIWFSGHSHWKWSLQKFQNSANIYRLYDDNKPGCGWCVHVPSCAYPIDSDGASREGRNYESEGAIVDVYENYIDIRGVDIKNGKYLPIATYRLDTTLFEVAEKEESADLYLDASCFTWNKGDAEKMKLNDVEDMPHYFEAVFTAPKQGWYMKNNTFVDGIEQRVSLSILDVQMFDWDGYGWIAVDMLPEKVGFYSGGYSLSSTNKCEVDATNGVQFQTSSSSIGPWPMKLRIKARAMFSPK